MKSTILSLSVALSGLVITAPAYSADAFASNEAASDHVQYLIVKDDVFYDGYYTQEILGSTNEDKITRHSNYLHEYPIDTNILKGLSNNFKVELRLGALCDNYDRMGRVMLSYRPKGEDWAENYNGENGTRIELGRFITPFMNKNSLPNLVPYEFELQDLSYILEDRDNIDKYDYFLQVEVFGVPYAANTQVRGCANRQDVFSVTVYLSWDRSGVNPNSPVEASANRMLSSTSSLIPIYTAKTEIYGNVNLNNYKDVATDTIGTATRTFSFNVDKDLKNSRLMLISTPHGAAENGEEYVRRLHLVYVDGELVNTFIPGGVSCEPYRRFNTQGNFIYGATPQDDWEEWNNWCPGQAVPIRRIDLGELKQGKHTVMLRVPDAEFFGNDGDIRPSMYLHGSTWRELDPAGVEEISAERLPIQFLRQGDLISFNCEEDLNELALYSIDGQLLEGRYIPGNQFSIADYAPGQYILVVIGESGRYDSFKLIKI